jgi:hypothetical protein
MRFAGKLSENSRPDAIGLPLAQRIQGKTQMNDLLRNKLPNRLAVACLVGGLSMSGAVVAATADGTVGATSTGTLDVSVAVPEVALIQNLNAISLSYTSGSDAVGSDTFCIWSTTGGYNVTITSLNGAGSFIAANGPDQVGYDVVFDDSTDPATGVAVTEGAIINSLATTETGFPAGCAGDNAVLEVTFPDANLNSAGAGVYTDEVTLIVAPE